MKIGESERISGPRTVSRTKRATSAYQSAATAAPAAVGDTVAIMGMTSEDMTPKVRDAIMSLMAEVDTLRRDLETANNRLINMEKLVDLDPLIPVSNRRAFVREISRTISFAERYGAPSSLIYFDLNNMKTLNDTYGHAAGDAALIQMADILSANIRDSDIIGRLGGDEFGVLLSHTDESEANQKAAELAAHVAALPLQLEGTSITMDVAYGVHVFIGGQNASQALAAADKRMYENKRARKMSS